MLKTEESIRRYSNMSHYFNYVFLLLCPLLTYTQLDCLPLLSKGIFLNFHLTHDQLNICLAFVNLYN